ncbi:MAG: glycosyltransferase family 4 protein [Methanoregulaceae archaeon]|nr:glycosyltransferase family 4 protein [Methanoregulaceae archaeon]
MKILQIGSALYDWGGIERYLAYLTTALTERGHDVWTTAPPGSPLEPKLAGRTVPIGVRRQFQFSRLAAYLRLFRANGFDVVNAHFSPDYIVPAIAARLARQPVRILTRHVVLHWSPTKVRRYTRLFTHFVGVSNAVEEKLAASGVPRNRITVAKAGIPPLEPNVEREAMREQLGLSGFSVGFFGRINADKGVDTVVEAARDLPANTFHVFGDGPLLPKLTESPGQVVFHGRIPDVANAMAAMDAVVIPSLWEEAFPYSALEAMSLGKPILATRSGGLPELVEDGVTGSLFEKRDASELAQLVRAWGEDSEFVASMGTAARNRHRTEYTLERFGERMESAYHWALESGS